VTNSNNIAIVTDKQVAGWWRVTGATAGFMPHACPQSSQQVTFYVAPVVKVLSPPWLDE